jgi:hypothetical protein
MLFGDPERNRREKQQKEADQDYYRHKKIVVDRQAAPKRLLIVKQKKINYNSLGSTNPNAFFNFGNKKRKNKRYRKKQNINLKSLV